MAGTGSGESGVGRSVEGNSTGDRCQSGEALAEWRSSEQLENGTPSTSPAYWDIDDPEDRGPKPRDLYGKYTWKIEKFSQINKRELRSNAFEVGGYKWYILIYPQGCDVCNHLSLFLCVANHDKLNPGWSHFAQFTIAVVNKDPKKSKYSDTLHRFWKKEHDWGWKKFMELSKIYDGFIDSDTLIIKAQVQVIRERAERPFRCLDCQYRRELVRVYLSNVEQICRRFLDERRMKLGKMIEDKARWSSFCSFWLGMDQSARRRMSNEKTDMILKVVVKQFFIDKEVTSTLVMDSLYSGLKALEGQSKSKKNKAKLSDVEDMPDPIVSVEKDMFILVDDVLLLLERAALEPLPPKDEKGPQNRTKDGNSGEDFNKEAIESDERRLTELGRRTVEIFVLAHIFSNKIEVAYQEAIALKRQEELIREEEAAWLAESEQKAKRAADKDKKSKKKQAKQKRNNRKGKDKGKEEKAAQITQDKIEEESLIDEKEDPVIEEVQPVLEKPEILEDVSDLSDSVDGAAEVIQPDSEDREASLVNWDTDTSEVHPHNKGSSGVGPNGLAEKKNQSVMDDSSSTCSTDSVPSVVTNGLSKGNSYSSYQNKKTSNRGRNQRGKVTSDGSSRSGEIENQSSSLLATDAGDKNLTTENTRVDEPETEAAVSVLEGPTRLLKHNAVKKEEVVLPQKKSIVKKSQDVERSKEHSVALPSSFSTFKNRVSAVQMKSDNKGATTVNLVPVWKPSSNGPQLNDQVTSARVSKPEAHKAVTSALAEKPVTQQAVPVVSRPSSAPIIPGPVAAAAPVISAVQAAPLLSRSVSAAGWLGPDQSLAPQNTHNPPQSYRNAMMGHNPAFGPNTSNLAVNQSQTYSQVPSSSSGLSFGMLSRDVLGGHRWIENSNRDANQSSYSNQSQPDDTLDYDMYRTAAIAVSRQPVTLEVPASSSGRQTIGILGDEFPHLDIINDLLDEEYGFVNKPTSGSSFQNGPQMLNRQYSYPNDIGMSGEMNSAAGSSGRLERSHSYHDDRYQAYNSSSTSHFESPREFYPQAYMDGQMDGLLHTQQWPMAGIDLSLLAMRNQDGDGYAFYNPEYSNLTAHGVNGYPMFRPSNGH